MRTLRDRRTDESCNVCECEHCGATFTSPEPEHFCPGCAAMIALRRAVGCRTCTLCDPEELHHWMVHCDEEFPGGLLICRHCEITRELRDEDLERYL